MLSARQWESMAANEDPTSKARLLAEADTRFEESTQIVRQLVADFPNRVRYREELIRSLWDQSSHLRKLATPQNQQNNIAMRIERTAKAERRLREQLAATRELVKEFPGNPNYEKWLADYSVGLTDCTKELVDLLIQSTRYDEALSLLERAPEKHPQLAVFHKQNADVLAKQGSPQEAVAALTERIGKYPEAIAYYLQRATLVARLGNIDQAIADYTRGIELAANNVDALVGRARLYSQTKQYDLSDTDFSKALELQPGAWWIKKLRAVNRIYAQQYDEALADLQDAIRTKPDDRSILTWLTLEAVANCHNEAFKTGIIALADEVVRLNGESPRSRLTRAQILTTVGQLDRARSDYASVIQSDSQPDDAMAYNILAWQLATCADPKVRDVAWAVDLATKAVELKPQQAISLNTLGVAQYRAGHWPAAIAALSKSEELESGKHTGFNGFFLAMAHWQLDRKDEAHIWYEKAVQWMAQNQPQNEELRRFRAEAADLLEIKVE